MTDPRAEPPSWLSSWAPPQSRLGALQRGRGDGFRAALAGGSEAAAEVIGCVIDDPRWDSQIETRDGFYARLLLAHGADLGPIAARLAAFADGPSQERSDLWLPLDVCSELAARGRVDASEIVANLAAHTHLWRPCLSSLGSAGGEALISAVISPAVAAAFVARAAPEQLDDAVDLIAAPWNAWAAAIPALRAALARVARQREGSPSPAPLDPSLSTEALLEFEPPPRRMRELKDLLDARRDDATTSTLLRVATTAEHPNRPLALRLLGRRECVDLLGEAAAFLRAEVAESANRSKNGRLRAAYYHYLEALPAEAVLPLARAWFHEPWPLSYAAGKIFGRHATADDRPVLEAAGSAALASGEMYRLCDVLEALEVVAEPASIAFLCAVVDDVPYAYARWRALAALAPHVERVEVGAILTDALWDAEVEARLVACEHADLESPSVRARLDEIVADDHEDEELRALAREVTTGS